MPGFVLSKPVWSLPLGPKVSHEQPQRAIISKFNLALIHLLQLASKAGAALSGR